MNSSAALKAFVGRNGGAVCTSSNAGVIMRWAKEQGKKILFVPDEHLDFHGTAEHYLRTKARFFDMLEPGAPLVVNRGP